MADNGDETVGRLLSQSRPDRLSALSPSRQELLRKLSRGEVVLPGEAPHDDVDDGVARASHQQRVVFAGGHQINLWTTLSLTGELSVATLQRSLKRILERHAVLRSTLHDDGETPRVRVWDLEDEEWWSFFDLRGEGEDRALQRAEELRRELSSKTFDPSVRPLFKVALFAISDTSHILHFLIDHLIFDGWSSHVLLDELTSWYNHFVGFAPAPEPLALQYADYARSQLRTLTGERRRQYARFWADHLNGIARRPEAPNSVLGERETLAFDFSQAALEQVQRQAADRRVSTFALLFTAYAVGLMHLEGADRFAIAIASANRGETGMEKLIGLFSNMIPTPVDLRGDVTLGEALGRLSAACMKTIGHQDAPPHWLRRELAELQAPGGPYANHSFILQNYPLPSLALRGIEARTLGADYGIGAKMDIDLLIVPGSSGWTGVLEFWGGKYRRAELRRLLVRMFGIACRFGDLAPRKAQEVGERLAGDDVLLAGLRIEGGCEVEGERRGR